MRTDEEVDAIMQTIPEAWRQRWCGGENGPCACLGCVQVGNRLVMAGVTAERCDPERIDERVIPVNVYQQFKITKEEWERWRSRSLDTTVHKEKS